MTDKGAHYFRSDFQVHTPRDNQWRGARATTDEERHEYGQDFIAACRAKNLHAVAITDHHDFTLYPYIADAAEAELNPAGDPMPEEKRIVVFPGLELTLGVPCQAILLLDPDFARERLQSVLELLGVEQTPETESTLPAVVRLDHIQSIAGLYELLDQRLWLKGRYTVLPNVTDKGHGTLMRSGMQIKYKEMPSVGGYLDGTVERKAKTGSGNRDIFDGRNASWGNKRIALFQTSDSRTIDFESLGEHSTWVKWSRPSAEAIRQACLAQESRIAHDEPAVPHTFIAAVHVTNSRFLGPVDLDFNPQYNAIIGGRGTGKSSILDYIRWCVGDERAVAEDDELPGTQRRRRLIDATLSALGAKVEVEISINGTRHIVRRESQNGRLLLKVGDAPFEETTAAAVRALLPIHAYSQKQLSSVAVRLDELTRFITSPIQRVLDAKDTEIRDVSDRLRENYGTLQRRRNLEATLARDQVTEQSLVTQAAHLRSGLTGLTEAHQRILDRQPLVEDAQTAVKAWRAAAERGRIAATALGDDLRRETDALPTGPDPSDLGFDLERVHDLFPPKLTDEGERADLIAGNLQALLAEKDVRRAEEWLDSSEAEYIDVKEKSSAHATRLNELSEVERSRSVIADNLAVNKAELAALGDPAARHIELRGDLTRLLAERSDQLARQCRSVTELSEGALKATVGIGRGFQDVIERFRQVIAGSGVRATRIDALFTELGAQTDPFDIWEEVLADLEQLLLLNRDVNPTTETTPTLSRLGLPIADQVKIRTRLTVDSWLDLSLTPIVDLPNFEYQTRESEYIDFEAASAGQQATALLKVLLAQTGMPLIIDQPEEDLDSQIIQEVVEWIWNAKTRRQIIFASHNANLVVNGDAELVAVCDYRRAGDQSGGRVKLEGAIDMPAVRDEITRVMEGGEKAFRLRKEKYGF